jgi:hypothetical protein
MADVVFVLGSRRVELDASEATEIRDRTVERTIASVELSSRIGREPAGEVVIDEEHLRSELLLCLDAIANDHELTDGQRALLEVARQPLGF